MILLAMICATSFVAACPGPIARNDAALFKDISKAPPDARPATIEAIAADPPFARWVIYQDRQCELHGCVR